MVVTPVLANLWISSILVSIGMDFFSFCSPSRGPTSTMRTWSEANRDSVAKRRVDEGGRNTGRRRRRGRIAITKNSRVGETQGMYQYKQVEKEERRKKGMEKRRAHQMRRAPCSFGPSVQTVPPHRKEIKSIAGRQRSTRHNNHGGQLYSTGQSAATAQEEICRQTHCRCSDPE